ncbi:MAG: SulP family inorganic anion transporter, partial [Actinomycetota bacterium]
MTTDSTNGARAARRRTNLRDEWLANPKADLLSGMVVALALIPEAISFSIIAGVDPKVGLYASFSIAIIIAFAGGRSGMISAATGAMALVLVPLVEDYGIEYLFAATILAGVLQVGLGYLGVGSLMRFIPRTVMVGFVNALAIL